MINREEIVHYSIGQVLTSDNPRYDHYTKENIADAIGINSATLDQYLTSLKKKKMLETIKRRYVKEVRDRIKLTEAGHQELRRVEKGFGSLVLSPERHNVPTYVCLNNILDRIDDPLERTYFISIYGRNKEFDLPMLLEAMKVSKLPTSMVNTLSREGMESQNTPPANFMETFERVSYLYGRKDRDISECFERSDVDSLLIVAEASHRRGKFADARAIYDYLLSSGAKVTRHQWFIARIGLVIVTRKEGRGEEALRMLDELIEQTDEKVYHAYARETKAMTLSQIGHQEEARAVFKSCLSSFKNFGFPLLLAKGLNNEGVMYFRSNDHRMAEKDWKKARKYAKESKSEGMEAFILCNLSDIALLKGEFELSKRYLNRAGSIFRSFGDYEGIADVEFNLALLKVEMKHLDEALVHFGRSETIAYPSPSPAERMERRAVFKERAVKNGFTDFSFLGEDPGPTDLEDREDGTKCKNDLDDKTSPNSLEKTE